MCFSQNPKLWLTPSGLEGMGDGSFSFMRIRGVLGGYGPSQ